ncbi:putative uncharacterized protein C8orf89 homolog [Tenrec ecaudatus]|uniref:putative uncharacterized protein C8orf89 homolog n=1 Tax=Tenrec ecaudatus TaxID=94439 RepID=UPI003F5A34CE
MLAPGAAPVRARSRPPRPRPRPAAVACPAASPGRGRSRGTGRPRAAAGSRAARCPRCRSPLLGCDGPGPRRSRSPPPRSCRDYECEPGGTREDPGSISFSSELLKEETRISVLSPEMKFKTSEVTRSSLDGYIFLESSWRKAVQETERMMKAFGLGELKECVKMPHLPRLQSDQKISSTPLGVRRRLLCPEIEVPVVRIKKIGEPCPVLSPKEISTSTVFTDPLPGAPPQFLQRLSKMAILEYDTVHQEITRKSKRGKKHNLRDC